MLPPQPDDRQYQYSIHGGRANDEERELVEIMQNYIEHHFIPADDMAKGLLSVVKANLGKIAEVCHTCAGTGKRYDEKYGQLNCFCNGTGIVPKGK